MITRQEIYDHFYLEDPRLPPFNEYIEEETRPYHDGDLVRFNLKGFVQITDRSNEGPGRNGGDNGRKIILPPIVYGNSPVNTTSPANPKVQGSLQSPIGLSKASDDSESDSFPTDSEEDTPDTGFQRRLARINHAIHNNEPIMVIFVGSFQGYCDRISQCEFRVDFTEKVMQNSMPDFFNANWQRICNFSLFMGGDSVPGSLNWTRNHFTEDVLVSEVTRFGSGVKVHFAHKDTPDVPAGIPMSEFEATFVTDLPYGLSIAFPAAQNLSDATLMQYMSNLTSSWDGTAWSKPWHIFLEEKPWRKSETGEIVVEAFTSFNGRCDPHAKNPRVPFNAARFPDECEIFNKSDISRTLKFARDNGWKCTLSCATSFDGTNALTVAYDLPMVDIENKKAWYWNRFRSLLADDGMIGFPAAARVDVDWDKRYFVGDHHVHIMLLEKNARTTEVDGPPCFWIYAPKAAIKIRAETIVFAHQMLTMCYNAVPNVTDQIHGKFWALIESIDHGEIPKSITVPLRQDSTLEIATAYNRETFMDGKVAQPYRIDIGKFTSQFKRSKPYTATIAVEKGYYGEHGTAILFEQENRKCLLTRRFYDSSDETIFWLTLKDWAEFEPRLAKPRENAGQVYHPAAYSHFVEQYWDFLHSPRSEDSVNEPMGKYASAAARLQFTLDMLVDSEAPDKSQEIAYAGAMSRRCPVQDAQDYWSSLEDQAQEERDLLTKGFKGMDRSSPDTDGPASSPDGLIVGTGLGTGTGLTGECGHVSPSPYTGDAFSLEG
jgi:hypothetical protein